MPVSTYYKVVRKPAAGETPGVGRSYRDGKTEWSPGAVLSVPSGSFFAPTGPGLYGAVSLLLAANYHATPSYFVQFTADYDDITFVQDDHMRFQRVTVVGNVADSALVAAFPNINIVGVNAPVHPLLVTPGTGLDLLGLLKKWVAVQAACGSTYRTVLDVTRTHPQSRMLQSVWRYIMGQESPGICPIPLRGLSIVQGDGDFHRTVDAAAAYAASMFTSITDWNIPTAPLAAGVSPTAPFVALVTLWNAGYLPVYDGTAWTLRTGATASNVALTYTPP